MKEMLAGRIENQDISEVLDREHVTDLSTDNKIVLDAVQWSSFNVKSNFGFNELQQSELQLIGSPCQSMVVTRHAIIRLFAFVSFA